MRFKVCYFISLLFLKMEQEVYDKVESFLRPIYKETTPHEHRPFITLTFAQSLDGKISKPGEQILISGKESLAMTHRLRTLHEGILVGIGTALVDDPQLTARFISPNLSIEQPQPIVIDPYLQLSPTCKLVQNGYKGISKKPWVFTSWDNRKPWDKKELENFGAEVIVIKHEPGRIPFNTILNVVKDRGIHSLMIEGGSKIIQSCLKDKVVDQLIITTAPMFIGSDGVPAITTPQDMSKLSDVRYVTLGNDVVMAGKRL